jgi:hypothetical protein
MQQFTLTVRQALAKTKGRRPDPFAHNGQQWIYQVGNPNEGLVYIGLSARPALRLKQHYNRPWESRLGEAMRSYAAGACLDWQVTFTTASAGVLRSAWRSMDWQRAKANGLCYGPREIEL